MAVPMLWICSSIKIDKKQCESGQYRFGITAFTFLNDAVWKGNESFVSDTVLKSENSTTISGQRRLQI